EEPVEVAPRQPVPLPRHSCLPQSMVVLQHGKPRNYNCPASPIPEPEAELDVCDSVEAELWIEAFNGDCIGATESHAVALDGINIRTVICLEFLQSAATSQAEWPGHHDGRI